MRTSMRQSVVSATSDNETEDDGDDYFVRFERDLKTSSFTL